jgi:hypothetical protein
MGSADIGFLHVIGFYLLALKKLFINCSRRSVVNYLIVDTNNHTELVTIFKVIQFFLIRSIGAFDSAMT